MDSKFRSISWQLFPVLIAGALVCGIAIWIGVPKFTERGVKSDALANAERLAEQFKIIRGYYTDNVVSKVIKRKHLEPTYTHQGNENEIPLPATFIHDLSKLLEDSGTALKLYSPYPFPVRSERQLDAFGKSAWEVLSESRDKPVVYSESVGQRDFVRVAVADSMVSQVCVDCHNSRADTPKNDWKLNDLRGILEIDIDVTTALARGIWIGRAIALALLGVLGAVILLTYIRLRGVVTGPINTLTNVMEALATGDLEAEIHDQHRRDEVGDMARAVQVFKDNAIRLKKVQDELVLTNSQMTELNASLEDRTMEIEYQAKELERSLEQEIENNALQRKFVAMVSHEFKTPLAIIDATTQRIARHKDKVTPSEIQERAAKIRRAVARLVGLIDRVLSTARLEAGKIEKVAEMVNLADMVEDVCKRQQDISTAHTISVDVGNLCLPVLGDPALLDQVFTNLLSNAVKYSAENPRVEVEGWEKGGCAVISVRDFGVGIPEKEIPNLFQRFFRATTSAGIAGTGIGLSIVKELVNMHGGCIDFASEEGKGSTFTVRLPMTGAADLGINSKNTPDAISLAKETRVADLSYS
ncbi:MAG: DUF3365 domain-containing protein [Rhodospirillaceae bacterium]|nr:DUF3365 domain-containing protein [Rhodospirillaceae bacterium]